MAISGGIGQFAGNVPLIGHNIQKNSPNVALRKCMPDNVVRSCVMQFGTQGLFGKARLRTARHDRDNAVKKNYRARKSLRSRHTSRRKTEGPLPAHDAPKSEYVPVERVLVFSPPPLPSPLPSLAASSSPPTPSVRGEHRPVIPTEGPVVCDNSVDSRPVALSASGCNGTLPASADSSNRSSSLSSLSSRSGGAYPTWRSALTGAFSYHDLALGSQYDTHTNQHCTYIDTRSAAPISTSGAHIPDAPFTTELAGPHGIINKSTRVSTLVAQVHSQMYVATGVEQAVNAPICTKSIVDQNINTTKNLHTHRQPLRHGTPCPTSSAPQCAPDSSFAPFAASGTAGSSNRVPSPSNHFAGCVALTGLESNGMTRTYQGYTSLDPRYATLVLTAAKLRDDARHAAQLVGSRATVDGPTRAPAFTGEVNSQIHSPTRTEHALKATVGDGPIVHVDAPIAEGFLPTYGLPQSRGTLYPALNTARDPSRPSYPLAAFVDPESPSDPDRSPSNHFAKPGVAHTWYSSQATTDPYAGEVGTPIAPYAALPVSTRRDASSVPDYTPLDSGYTASLRSFAGHECEHSVTPPQIAYPPFPVSSSYGATLNTLPLSYDTVTNNSPSSSLANTLGNHDTQPSGVPYHGVDGTVPSAQSGGTFGPSNASTRAREITWQMIPEPGFAPVAAQTVDDLSRGRPGPDANASCQCAEYIANKINRVQGLEGCFDTYSPSWSPTIPRSGRTYLDTAGSQWDDGAYPNAAPALHHPRPCFLPPG